ncbi:MAG: hypothetical protein IJS15_11390 [Victivallales bacterium]|nr:hypothetical protein [Victivallales bacterium]
MAIASFAELLDDGRVSVVHLPDNYSQSAPVGNRHYSFRVGNHSNATREIALNLSSNTATVRRSAKIPAGESVIMTLVYPSFSSDAISYHAYRPFMLEVSVEGKAFPAQSTTAVLTSSSGNRHSSPYALCSTSVPSEEFEAIYGNHSGGGYYYGLYGFIRSPLSVGEWSREVSDYMNYRIIWVTAEETIPPDVEKAMRKWVFHGGKLIRCVMGTWPSDLPYNYPADKPEKYCHEERYGFGSIMTFKPYLGKNDGVAEFARKVRDEGGGFWNHPEKHPACVYLPESLPEILAAPDSRVISKANLKTGCEELMMAEPETPIGMLVLIMTVFVLIVGPLNYIFLMKRRHTALMVVTIPLVSMTYCLLVFVFVAVSSGFSIRGKIYGFTYLNQNDKLASTCALVSLLAPNMTRRDLVFDTDDQVRFYHETHLDVLDKPGMQIDSGCIPVRTVLNYTVNRCGTSNERLRFNWTGPHELEMVNGLSAPISHFLYRDSWGHLYYAENVPEGQRAKLEKLAGDAQPPLPNPSPKEIGDMLERMRREERRKLMINMTEAEEMELARQMAIGAKCLQNNQSQEARDAFETVLLKNPSETLAIKYLARMNKQLEEEKAKSLSSRQKFLDDSKKIVFETLFRDIADGKDVKKSFLSAMTQNLPSGMYAALTRKPMFYSPGLLPDKGEIYHLVIGDNHGEKLPEVRISWKEPVTPLQPANGK